MFRSNQPRRLFLEPLESRQLMAITVTTLVDQNNPGAPDAMSLREAIFFTNLNSDNEINFAPALSGGTILLNSELVIEDDVSILGPGADKLTISANGNHRLISVVEGFREIPNVEIRGLKLTGANTSDSGAAIRSFGANLIVRNSWITGNESTSNGSGLLAQAGTQNPGTRTVTIIGSTISGNTTTKSGGGVHTSGVELNVINSTISGNTANDQGGGLLVASGTVKLVNSTIARNRADANAANDPGNDRGGGISRTGGSVTLQNSLVLGNYRGTSLTPNDIDGTMVATSTRNIIGNAASSGGLQHSVNANIVGTNGSGTLGTATVIVPTLQLTAGVIPAHALVTNSLAIDSGSNSLAVDHLGASLTKDERGVKRKVDGNLNGIAIVDRGAVEFARAPTLGLSGSLAYTEQDAAKVISSTATITDLDSPNFNGGNLKVAITGSVATDRLAIRNQGNAPGQIGISGNQVKYGGTVIGTFTGGTGITFLRVSLNANATTNATQALLRNITFQNVADAPPTASRNISFTLTDDSGLTSATRNKAVTISAVNDAPQIELGSGGGTYVLNRNVPQRMGPNVSDSDLVNFNGGKLTVSITQNASAKNRLDFSAPFSRVGNLLKHNGITIGTLNANGGIGTTDLVVTFNTNATNQLVVQLVRGITFYIANAIETEPIRRIQFTLTDGDGGTSNAPIFVIDPEFIRS